jgi:aspartate ammonia-lyase
MHTRTEVDLLGSREVPADAYYGIHTLRAIENFRISPLTINDLPQFIRAMVEVKKASAIANRDLHVLPADIANAIVRTPATSSSTRGGAWTSSRSTSSRAAPAPRST